MNKQTKQYYKSLFDWMFGRDIDYDEGASNEELLDIYHFAVREDFCGLEEVELDGEMETIALEVVGALFSGQCVDVKVLRYRAYGSLLDE